MNVVSALNGIEYGFQLFGYLLIVALIGGGAIGVGVATGNGAVMLIFGSIGVLVIYAGLIGTLYKVIADGVATGMMAVNEPGSPPASDAERPDAGSSEDDDATAA